MHVKEAAAERGRFLLTQEGKRGAETEGEAARLSLGSGQGDGSQNFMPTENTAVRRSPGIEVSV